LKNDFQLRKKISGITTGYDSANQNDFMRALSQEYPHSIKLIKEDLCDASNCYMYALDMTDSPELKEIASSHGTIFPNWKFIMFLIDNDILKEKNDNEYNNDIIIYFNDDDIPTHAGKISANSVTSKWGRFHIWEHGIFEIPMVFGNKFKTFSKISRKSAIDSFLKYADLKINP